MLRAAVIARIAQEHDFLTPEQVVRLIREHRLEIRGIPFEHWAAQRGELRPEESKYLSDLFADLVFQCMSCMTVLRGHDFRPGVELLCNSCGSTALKRIDQGTQIYGPSSRIAQGLREQQERSRAIPIG